MPTPNYCKCVFLGDELAMKNYHDPGVAAATGADGDRPRQTVPSRSEMIQEIDPGIGMSIFDGDILDYSY